ncbi:MAG: hypothetical protein AAGA72_03450 [Pseudomonadota bacterium]
MFRNSVTAVLLNAVAAGAALACPMGSDTSSVEVYPTGDVVPENLLRIYVYFPRPMSPRVGASDIELYDPDGKRIDNVFLPNRYDLWSADRTRLTLVLDPGRVKTGLNANEQLGRALHEGQTFTLNIPGALQDQQGCPLSQTTKKRYTVTAEDLDTPSPEEWTLSVPEIDTRQALSVDLTSPHDHISLAYRLRVFTEAGLPVAGALSVQEHESVWTFEPSEMWKAERYEVRIAAELEDLAGNRPGILFDRPPNAPLSAWQNSITFKPKSQADG